MVFSRKEKLSNDLGRIPGGQEKLPSDAAACPIGLDKIHCQSCWFWRGGRCDYRRVMIKKERSQKGVSP
jgi:hypothetical protein